MALTVRLFQACSSPPPPPSPSPPLLLRLLLVTVSMFQCAEFLVLVSLGLFGFGIWRARELARNVEQAQLKKKNENKQKQAAYNRQS